MTAIDGIVNSVFLLETADPFAVHEQVLSTIEKDPRVKEIERKHDTDTNEVKNSYVSIGDGLGIHLNSYSVSDSNGSPYTIPGVGSLEFHVGASAIHRFDENYEHKGERVELYLDAFQIVYEALDKTPLYAYAVDAVYTDPMYPVPVTRGDIDGTIPGVASWIMVFPPSLVDSYGAKHLRSASTWRTTDLVDGSIMLVAFQDPTDPDEIVGGLEEIAQHLDVAVPN